MDVMGFMTSVKKMEGCSVSMCVEKVVSCVLGGLSAVCSSGPTQKRPCYRLIKRGITWLKQLEWHLKAATVITDASDCLS